MFFQRPFPDEPALLGDRRYRFPRTRSWRTWTIDRETLFERWLGVCRNLPVKFLEIGSFEGASAIWTLSNILTHPDSTLTCVDNNHLRSDKQFLANLEASGHRSRATVHWIDSHDIRRHVPDEHFDFIYVDGSHAAPNVLFDVVNAFLICKPGGLVGCDDYLFKTPEAGSVPKPAIDSFVRLMGDRIEIVHSAYQLWFRKREGTPGA